MSGEILCCSFPKFLESFFEDEFESGRGSCRRGKFGGRARRGGLTHAENRDNATDESDSLALPWALARPGHGLPYSGDTVRTLRATFLLAVSVLVHSGS
jgi:hypothetical protein